MAVGARIQRKLQRQRHRQRRASRRVAGAAVLSPRTARHI